MNLSRLQTLKEKLTSEKQLSKVWNYFLDHFGENAEFLQLGEKADDEFLEAVVAQIGDQFFPGDGKITHLLLTRLAKEHFIHGAVGIGGRMAGVIYFEDAKIGLVASADYPPSKEAKYARFSGRLMRPPAAPSAN